MFRSGFVAVIGRPNVGKSTLVNRIVGEKVAIVSPKPQTTRNKIKGVLNREGCQIIFLDTPGIHRPRTELGEYMVKSARSSLEGVDAVLIVLDATTGLGQAEMEIIESVLPYDTPKYIVVNKTDAAGEEAVFKLLKSVGEQYKEIEDVYPLSARSGKGVEALVIELARVMPEGPQYFDDAYYTDQPERVMVAEIIREKALYLLREEIPHGMGVEVERMRERSDGVIEILAAVYCERKSHKAIIIGKSGAMLKEIGKRARVELESLLGGKVYLELWVKIEEDWRNKKSVMKDLGYSD